MSLLIIGLASGQASNLAAQFQATQNTRSQLLNSPENITPLQNLLNLCKNLHDAEIKSAAIAVYAMGMLYNCQNQEASKGAKHLQANCPSSPCLALLKEAQYCPLH